MIETVRHHVAARKPDDILAHRALPQLPLIALGMSLGSFFATTFVFCVLFDLWFPSWAMNGIWSALLPGFTWLTWPSFFLGLAESFGYGWYAALVFGLLYSFFSQHIHYSLAHSTERAKRMPETGSSETAASLPVARLSIDGMHCLSCVLRIESALEDLPGVVTAAVDLVEGTATIVYKPNAVTLDEFTQAVSKTGYRVTGSAMGRGGYAA